MSTGVTVTAMRDEAVRLIDLQQEILRRIRDDGGLSFDDVATSGKEQPAGEAAEFGEEDIARKLNALDENRTKLQDFEAVLAVVGTMKAGKSTTINAIVGREILPNRNRPMTSLPTLIRHVPGRDVPMMRLQKVKPLEDLVKRLKSLLPKASARARTDLAADKALADLARDIEAGMLLRGKCEGEECIRLLLAQLNDLVRLSALLGLDFPYDAYASITDFPVIEVAFRSLGSFEQATSGRLALLDTPGFNEDGHADRLFTLMNEQLERASAVLAVLDYTQLKSTAEAELRAALERIAPHAKGRMFAVVNRFDAKDANGDGEQETRDFVSRTLLQEQIPAEHIYPVSAKLAFLAVRAANTWKACGTLGWKEGDPESWVTDFADLAWGRRWRDCIERGDGLESLSEGLWKDSRFEGLLTNVVRFAHRKAAEFALDAATAELEKGWGPLSTMLKTRDQGFGASQEKVKDLIEKASQRIDNLRKLQRSTQEGINAAVSRAQEALARETAAATQEAKQRVVAFLSDTGIPAPLLLKEQLKAELERFPVWKKWGAGRQASDREGYLTDLAGNLASNFEHSQKVVRSLKDQLDSLSLEQLRGFFARAQSGGGPGGGGAAKGSLTFDPTVAYHSREEAVAALMRASGLIAAVLHAAGDHVRSVVQDEALQLRQEMQLHVKDLKGKSAAFQEAAAGAGFHALVAEVPVSIKLPLEMEQELDVEGVVEGRPTTRFVPREQKGTWAWFKRKLDVFNQDWGVDQERVSETRYVIGKAEMQSRYHAQVETAMQALAAMVQQDFCEPARDLSERFFQKVRSGLERIERNLVKVQMDHARTGEEQQRIRQQIRGLQVDVQDAQNDTAELAKDAKASLEAAR